MKQREGIERGHREVGGGQRRETHGTLHLLEVAVMDVGVDAIPGFVVTGYMLVWERHRRGHGSKHLRVGASVRRVGWLPLGLDHDHRRSFEKKVEETSRGIQES